MRSTTDKEALPHDRAVDHLLSFCSASREQTNCNEGGNERRGLGGFSKSYPLPR